MQVMGHRSSRCTRAQGTICCGRYHSGLSQQQSCRRCSTMTTQSQKMHHGRRCIMHDSHMIRDFVTEDALRMAAPQQEGRHSFTCPREAAAMGRGLRSAYSSCHGCPSSWAMRLMAVALSKEGTCSQQQASSTEVGLHRKQALNFRGLPPAEQTVWHRVSRAFVCNLSGSLDPHTASSCTAPA